MLWGAALSIHTGALSLMVRVKVRHPYPTVFSIVHGAR